jgi:hypothetical protein
VADVERLTLPIDFQVVAAAIEQRGVTISTNDAGESTFPACKASVQRIKSPVEELRFPAPARLGLCVLTSSEMTPQPQRSLHSRRVLSVWASRITMILTIPSTVLAVILLIMAALSSGKAR